MSGVKGSRGGDTSGIFRAAATETNIVLNIQGTGDIITGMGEGQKLDTHGGIIFR